MKLDFEPLMKAVERYLSKADDDLKKTLESEGFVAAGMAVDQINAIEDAVTDALVDNADEVLERLQTATGVDDFIEKVWPKIKDEDDLVKALHDIFEKRFNDMLSSFTKEWVISVDPELGQAMDNRITNPAVDFVKGWSSKLADLMKLSTNQQIENILLDAAETHKTVDQVTDIIAASGIREPGYRSRTVAITEVLRMEEYAHQEARVQNPCCYKKMWRHTFAEHPRENHIAMDGQTVFKREKFTLIGRSGGVYMVDHPRDTGLPAEESVNCHCTTDDIVDDDILGMPLEDRLSLRQQLMDEVDKEYADSGLLASDIRIGGEKVDVFREQHTFTNGNGEIPATVYKTEDGKKFMFPENYDTKNQTMTPHQAVSLFQRVPQGLRDQGQEVIEFVDYENPMDAYWRQAYKNFTSSYATGGDAITFYKYTIPHDEDYAVSTYCHEIGHFMDRNAATTADCFSSESLWTTAMSNDMLISGKASPTSYGENANTEDFAVSIEEYVANRKSFEKDFPNRAAILALMI